MLNESIREVLLLFNSETITRGAGKKKVSYALYGKKGKEYGAKSTEHKGDIV